MTLKDLKKLEKLIYFTKDTLRLFEAKEDALNSNIGYWRKKGNLIFLKKGTYTLKTIIDKEIDKAFLLEFFANKIYEPSYLSCEYVMQKYGLLTESVFGITSISTNKTNKFINNLGTFSYYSVVPRLFDGFSVRTFKDMKIFEANKEKATFDYLYLRFLKNADINEKSVEELRINWENLKSREFVKMKKWITLAKNKRIIRLYEIIQKKHYA